MSGDFDAGIIQADFDRLALLSRDGWDHNSHYGDFLLKHIPQDCESALEIGCGAGAFARLMAKRAGRVLALDLSPQVTNPPVNREACSPNAHRSGCKPHSVQPQRPRAQAARCGRSVGGVMAPSDASSI